MSVFASELYVGFAPGERLFVLEKPLLFWSGVKVGEGVEVICPAGFETDFASVPRLFWGISPPWGWFVKAAVLHDYLYSLHGLYRGVRYPRQACDRAFYSAMWTLAAGDVHRQKVARFYYRAVRLFGGGHF